jgi:hypothetical protein
MCDPNQVFFKRPLHATQSHMCYVVSLPTSSGIACENYVLNSSFTISVDKLPISVFSANDYVCWTNVDGYSSCSNGLITPSLRVADIQLSVGGNQRFSLLNDTLRLSQSDLTSVFNFTFPDENVNIFAVGPASACVVNPDSNNSFTCDASISDLPYDSLTQNPTGFYNSPIVDLRINTTTVFWVNEAHSISWFGVPGCDGSNPLFCSSYTGEISVTSIPPNTEAIKVSPGFLQACVVTPSGTLSCWGPYAQTYTGWQTITNAADVYVYDDGGCAIYNNYLSATCWGSISKTLNFVPVGECIGCYSNSALVVNDVCVNCSFGQEASFTTSLVSLSCVNCVSHSVRGPLDTICVDCGDGKVPNSNSSLCIDCLPSQYLSNTMNSCTECGIGSQSYIGGSSCTSCSDGLYRSLSMVSCSSCALGSLPNESKTACLSCPLPYYCSTSVLPYTSFSQCSCTLCPNGTEVDGFLCVSCQAPKVRVFPSQTCFNCPEGFEPNTSFTACLACTENTVRTNPSPYCFDCPYRTRANETHTRCISTVVPFQLSPTQYIFIGSGVLVILLSWGIHGIVLNKAQLATGILLGILLIIIGFILPVLQDKQK